MPVGKYDNQYTGTFEGGGHTVYNLAIGVVGSDNDTYAGFFGYVGSDGTVQDLGVEIASFTSAYNTGGEIIACYWSDYNGKGIGNGGTDQTTKVDGSILAIPDGVSVMVV